MSKGGEFEWAAARDISRWLTGGVDSKQLIRSVLSGGWSGRQESTRPEYQVGDLAPNGEQGARFKLHFGVECKASKEQPNWWTFFYEPAGELEQWWVKLCHECSPYRLAPLLVMKRNNQPVVVATTLAFSRITTPLLTVPKHCMAVFAWRDVALTDPEEWFGVVEDDRDASEGYLHDLWVRNG